jgi:hypothetical protein
LVSVMNRDRTKSLSVLALPTVQQTGSAAAQYPELSEPEQLERDIALVRHVELDLKMARSRGDLQDLRAKISLAERQFDNNRLVDLVRRLNIFNEPATRADIANQLMMLIGSFPSSTQIDLTVYTRTLAEDVGARAPSRLSLDIACRKLRRTAKFKPTISELYEALDESEKWLADRRRSIDDFPRIIKQMWLYLQEREGS